MTDSIDSTSVTEPGWLARTKAIAGLIRDIGIVVGVPLILTVGWNLYDIQAKSFDAQIKANESRSSLLKPKITSFGNSLMTVRS